MLSHSLTGRIRAEHAQICVCVCLWLWRDSLCSLHPWPIFFSAQGLRRLEGFQVMCVSVVLQPCHPCSAEFRLPVDYGCHHLGEIRLRLILSSSRFSSSDIRDAGTSAKGGQLVKAPIVSEWGVEMAEAHWFFSAADILFLMHKLLIPFLLLNHPSPGKTQRRSKPWWKRHVHRVREGGSEMREKT